MKKTLLPFFIHIITLFGFSQENNNIYEKFFSNPVSDIPFPIVNKNSNYYTDYYTVIDFMNNLALKQPNLITVGSIGTSQRGFNVPYIEISKKNVISDADKIRVCFLASVHGNEPISTDGMLYLMNELANNKNYSDLLNNIIVKIIPIVNVDGHLDDKREATNETDLNRNLTILDVVETVNIKNAINIFDPHIVVDFHEYNPSRKDYLEINDCFTSSYDAMFLYSGNLNVNSNIKKIINENFVVPTKLVLEQNNRRVTDYITTTWVDKAVVLNIGGNSARSSATNYALQNRISILMELRGVSEKGKATKRRIETAFITAISYLEIAAKNANLIKSTIQKANQETIDIINDIVLESKAEIINFPFVFVNTCANKLETVNFDANLNINQTPIFSRKRPNGYIIVTNSQQILKTLNASGVIYQTTTEPTKLMVETYKQEDGTKYDIVKQFTTIPKGSIIINESQKMGNLIIELLEPEINNSFVSNKLLKPFKDTNILRIYRINKEQVLQFQNKK